MISAPAITLNDLREQLETQSSLRIPATVEDYFELLDQQADDVYLEFDNHHLIARPNVNTENHELITASVIGLLYQQITSKPEYRVMGSNRPVYVKDCELGFAPDVLVIKGPTELYPRKKAMAATLNPWLMVEVMSDSNRGEEFQHKLLCYKQIPALQHILLIEQDYHWVSVFSRTTKANQWLNTDFLEATEIVRFDEFALPLAEIYRSVVFAK
jgi:Uma2 family endonuclease